MTSASPTKPATPEPFTRSADLRCLPLRPRLPDGLDLEIVVPAYNEERRIRPTLLALGRQLRDMPIAAGLRVVDNGSCDRTAEIVDQAGDIGVPVAVSGCSRPGKGAAVARGMVTSSARWVGFCDADLATDPGAIADAVRLLERGWQVVVGSRRCAQARVVARQPLVRRLGSSAFHRVTRRYTGGISDTQCGFKFFDGLVASVLFGGIELDGFAFDVEVLARAHAMGLSMVELPVEWRDQPGSTFAPVRDGVRVAGDLWRLRRISPAWTQVVA
ncbi:glycosyltransferase [Actinoplanes sp. NPDC048967]|uniref:glycosyltransferase n=1 Tax=Actinoplanes sp. NPDC048967 TaxID=3155269 RepID=UPI0034005FA1